MKNVVRIAACMVVLMIALNSCTKDEETNPEEETDSFNGTWNVSENSTVHGPSTYVATISNTSPSVVTINRLYELTKGTTATVNGRNLTIQSQIIDGLSISGSAVMENASRISFKYFVQITAKKTDTVSSIFTK